MKCLQSLFLISMLSHITVSNAGISNDASSLLPHLLDRRKDGETCCLILSQSFPSKLVTPDQSLAFQSQRQSYWSNQQREVSPACFLKAKSSKDVAAALKTLSTNQCKFAIKSGGHTPIKESSNIQNGVTLDLSDFKGIEVATDRSYVNIRPGNRWIEVYTELEARGLQTSGGRVTTVGVGGLVTGGGISFFARERGLACDNVLEFEVVLANSSIVIARANSHADLFRALKGGSGNFGIVTRIKIKTFEYSGKMWGGIVFHKSDDTTRIKLSNHFANSYAISGADGKSHWIYTVSFVNAIVTQGWTILSNIQHASDTTSAPDIFKPVVSSDVALLPIVGQASVIQQSQSMALFNAPGNRQLFATLTFKNNAAFIEEFYHLADEHVQEIRGTFGLTFSISFQALPHSAYRHAEATGGNALGLEDDESDLVIVLLSATWQLGQDDQKVYDVSSRLFERGHSLAVHNGLSHKLKYLNYAAGFQDPIADYGSASIERLRAVSAKFDPEGVFQILVPGGFKIPVK